MSSFIESFSSYNFTKYTLYIQTVKNDKEITQIK